ncbi:hypothetical protein EPO66_00880, partial [bacterium]
MRLTVTTNWADDFIEKISGFKEVSWIRGRLYKDEVGGQLSYRNFANIPTRKTVEKNIKKIHSIGKEFSYIIDGHCLENKEYSWEGQERIRELIKWISDSGADSVTVAIPHLVEVIKGQFPSLKIDFGTHRSLAEIQRLKYFDKLGCDTIAVRSDYNRNFALLKLFKKSVKCKLKLTLNSLCLYYCNFANDHENLLSHTSNFTTKSKFSRYYNFVCDFERMESPEEVIKSPFIRPEDLAVYESLGFEDFILEPNSALTEDVLCMINAYTSRKYEGNLLEIMSVMGEKPFSDGKGRIDKRAPRLESKKLKTFLRHFIKGDGNHCLASICGVDCQYCKKWSGVI